jgi:membrane protein required for colicin V production
MSLTILDVIVVAVVLVSAVLAMVRGFVREVLSIASWLAAAAAAYLFYKPLLPLVRPYFESGTVATIVAAAAIFFIALIVASYVTMKISDLVIDSRVGALDRAFGFLFGAARGVFLMVIALLFFGWLVPNPPGWVVNASTKPVLDDLGDQLVAALPEDIEATIVRRFRGSDDSATGGTPSELGVDPNDPNYDPGDRQDLDQLIEGDGSDGN